MLPLESMHAVYDLASRNSVPVHIDGARVFNAAAALRTESRNIAQHGDSICFCVSKGLSAPVGSLLCGTDVFVERARAFRRMVGGNMRQAGPLAAAGIVALETMVDRLAQDHATAKRLAQGLNRIDAALVDPAGVETNIVKVEVPRTGPEASAWAQALEKNAVRVSPCERYALRFVTHRHIGEMEIGEALRAFEKVRRALGTAR